MDETKVLIYFENHNALIKSGIGRAMYHQTKALELAGVSYTLNKKDNYNIAHINTYSYKSQRLLRKCKKRGIPVVVHGHSTIEDFRDSFRCWKFMSLFFYKWLRYMYKNADFIIAPTKYTEELIDGYGYKKPINNISNGISLEDYKEEKEKQRKFREYFALKEDEKVVIGVGFLFKRKGLIDFFEIARHFPDVKFIWFGDLQRILTTRKILKAIKKKPENVIMAGYMSDDIIIGAYQSASLLLFPSYEETEGIVVLEAQASRLPVLARDIGVFNGWLKDGENAFLAKDNEEFIKKTAYILENSTTNITENGYNTVAKRSLDKIGEKLNQTYKKVRGNYYGNKT